MDPSQVIREARKRSGMTLRLLAANAGTSHSTLAAYESGSKSPNASTLNRVLEAAGFAADVSLHRRHRWTDGMTRGAELEAVLELAEAFPARDADKLEAPIFPRRPMTP